MKKFSLEKYILWRAGRNLPPIDESHWSYYCDEEPVSKGGLCCGNLVSPTWCEEEGECEYCRNETPYDLEQYPWCNEERYIKDTDFKYCPYCGHRLGDL